MCVFKHFLFCKHFCEGRLCWIWTEHILYGQILGADLNYCQRLFDGSSHWELLQLLVQFDRHKTRTRLLIIAHIDISFAARLFVVSMKHANTFIARWYSLVPLWYSMILFFHCRVEWPRGPQRSYSFKVDINSVESNVEMIYVLILIC